MPATNINTLTTKLNGRGISFMDFFHKGSPLFAAIFYDWDSLMNPTMALKPKEIATFAELLEDGYTLKWRDTDLRRENSASVGVTAAGAATLNVTTGDGALFRAGDNIYLPAYGNTHVVTAVATDALTISPVVPTGDYAALTPIKIVSTAVDNGGTVGGKDVYVPVGSEVTNYIQHFSHQFTLSQEELNKVLLKYTMAGLSEKQAVINYVKDKTDHTIRQIQTDIVNAFWVNDMATQTISGKTYRYTGGINYFKDSTTVDCTDSTDKARLLKIIDALDAVSGLQNLKGDFSNILVCTVRAKSRISALASQFITGVDTMEISKIGLRIEILRTTYGDIPIYVDPILTNLTADTNMGYVINPRLISLVSTTQLPANLNSGYNDSTTLTQLNGVIFHKDQTSAVQPHSPAVVNAYTNLGFKFQGSSMGLYKKLINLGE